MLVSQLFPRIRPRQLSAALFTITLAITPLTATAASSPKSPGDPGDLYDVDKATFQVAPGTLKPFNGKFADQQPILLHLRSCTGHSANTNPPPAGESPIIVPLKSSTDNPAFQDSDYQVTILAPGLAVADTPVVTECDINLKVKITAEQVVAGSYLITVVRKKAGSVDAYNFGNAVLSVLDTNAGNIPGNSTVDAYWSVLSEKVCSKNFGRAVRQNSYCIEVKIGNNSGYPLQLAGIGFRRALPGGPEDINANLAYRAVRGVAQAQDFFTRSTIIDSVASVGLVMTGFAPFFHAANNVGRWGTGSDIVGTALPKALSQAWRDPAQQQMNNLDDESFRDNIIIANNTQVRTTVFLDKTLLDHSAGGYLKQACDKMFPLVQFDNDEAKRIKDSSYRRCLLQFGDFAKGDSSTFVFSEKKRPSDPNLVKIAMGNLVIVGYPLKYQERIVVDKNALAAATSTTQNPQISSPTVPPTLEKGKAVSSFTVTLASTSNIPAFVYAEPVNGGDRIQFQVDPTSLKDKNITYIKSSEGSLSAGKYKLTTVEGTLLTAPGDYLVISDATAPAQPAQPAPAANASKPPTN